MYIISDSSLIRHSLHLRYKVTVDDFFRHDGRSLLVEAFHSSPQELLKAVFPAINWKPWLFSRVPKNFYDKMENVRLHLDDIKAEAGVEDDGEVKMEHFAKFGGGALLARFNNSPQLVVEVAGGTYQSNKKPMNYWKNVENQKLFLEELARKLNIGKDEKEKWYDVDSEVVGKEGGATLLSHYYGGSMHALLKSVYPGYGWEPWRFRHVDQFAWKDKEVVLKAVKAAETKLGLSKKEDWYFSSFSPPPLSSSFSSSYSSSLHPPPPSPPPPPPNSLLLLILLLLLLLLLLLFLLLRSLLDVL